MLNAAAFKMAADELDADTVPKVKLIAFPKPDMGTGLHHMFFIIFMDINRAAEGFGPVVHIAVVMRVRKTNGLQPAF